MVEALVELATMKRSPWLQHHDWSSDAHSLRELAIRRPWIVTDEFVWNHFKSLYLVDKCVSKCVSYNHFQPSVNDSDMLFLFSRFFCLVLFLYWCFFGFSYCVPFTDALILWLAVLHCVHQTFSHYSLFLVVFFSMQLISAHTRSLNATIWYLTCKYLRNCTNTFFILLFKDK